jgi:anti-sigma regulatory factor (Ser/Thr protein kinase)
VNAHPLPEHADGVGRVTLSVHAAEDLSAARATVTRAVISAGIDEDRAAKLAIAVSEIATNALVHGDGAARLEIVTTHDRVAIEIADKGPGLPTGLPVDLPAAEEERGRGLWLAEQLCDQVEVRQGGNGARIVLSVRR